MGAQKFPSFAASLPAFYTLDRVWLRFNELSRVSIDGQPWLAGLTLNESFLKLPAGRSRIAASV